MKDYWAFSIIAIFIVFYLHNKEFLHYDNFSHWGRIAKFLIENDRLNGADDTYIIFNTYPQMSAYSIYGLIRLLGFRENLALMANAFALLSGYFVLYEAFKKNIVSLIVFFIFSIYIFMDNTAIDTLLVDSLIASIGFAGLIFSYDIDFNKNKKASFLLIPIFFYLTLIKNSSIYFSVIIFVFLLLKYRLKNILPSFISILSLIFSYKSWLRHINNTFTSFGKHSVNKDAYEEIYKEKSIEDLNLISNKFKKVILDERIIFILLLALLVIYLFLNKNRVVRNLLISSLLIFVVYEIGIYYMYLYSMPKDEAIKLASYLRYSKTIRFYLILLNFYILVDKFYKSRLIISLIMIFIICLSYKNFKNRPNTEYNKDYNIYVKHELEKFYNKNLADKNILISIDENPGYFNYMAGYIFEKSKTKITEDTNSTNTDDYDYFIDLKKTSN